MNKPFAIILLAVLALVLILAIRALIPMFTNFLKNLPVGIFILFLVAILGIMAYLIYFLINADTPGGQMGKPAEELPQVTEAPEDPDEPEVPEEVPETLKHCIVLKGDRIWIENQQVNTERVQSYIDEHVLSNTELIIVDDYALASLHHEITKLCDKKGVNYRIENEKWIEE